MKKGVIAYMIGALWSTGMIYAYERPCESAGTIFSMLKENPDEYCAKMRDGKMVVIHDGKELTSDVFLANGTTIKPDGTVITRDGVRTQLKEGECVDANGKINHIKKSEPYQK